jgi:nitrile hydratase accessory protein
VDHFDRLYGNSGYVAQRIAAEVSGPSAIPRRNGEPLFEQPWESRIFGAAVVLCEQGLFEWDEFRERLIAEIGAAEAETAGSAHPPAAYYEHFLASLERVLVDKGICASEEIARRIELDSTEIEHR